MKLSDHFTFADVVRSTKAEELGINNALPEALMGHAKIAADGMEQVRALLGNHPVNVTSWYRCPALNLAVGGATESAHLIAFAVDFICDKFGAPIDIVRAIIASAIRFDKCIQEGHWVHISFDPQLRQQVMTAHFDASGKATYTNGIT